MAKLNLLNEFIPLTKEEKICKIKKSYPDRGRAKVAGQILGKKLSRQVYYYKCDTCLEFHLTKMKEYKKNTHAIC